MKRTLTAAALVAVSDDEPCLCGTGFTCLATIHDGPYKETTE